MRRVPADLETFERELFDAAGGAGCPRADLLLPALEGVLPDPLGARVRAHAAACPLCRDLVEALSAGPAAEPDEGALDRIHGRVKAGRRSWLAIIRWPAVAAAALVAAGLVFARLAPGPIETPPVASRGGDVALPAPAFVLALSKPAVELPPEALVLRGGDADPAVTALIAALEPYRRDDFAEAADRLEAVVDAYPDARHAQFYLGVSRLLAGRAAEAVGPLSRAAQRAPAGSWLRAEATWYLAVSSERDGDRGGALGALADLCGRPGPRREAACDGLRRLTPVPEARRQEISGAEGGAQIMERVVALRRALRADGRRPAGA